jgi:hypothetical protein
MARFGSIGTQYFDSNGDPLSGGKLYFYVSGTTTPQDTYTTPAYTIANTNPVILTSGGRQPSIFFEGSAKAILTDSSGVQIEVRDPIGDTTTFTLTWSATEIYSLGDLVTGSDNKYYSSLQSNNINNNPVTPSPTYWGALNVPSPWTSLITYSQYQIVTGTDGNIYYSLAGSNLNHNPVLDTSNTYWIGSVRGPGVAVNNRVATFNGTTGNLIKDSGTLITGLATSGANSNITSLTGLTTPLAVAQGGTNSTATPTAGGIGYGTGTAYAYSAAGTLGQVLTSAGAGTPTWSTAATGSVTSVSATVPSLLSISGSPITSSGTLAFTYSGTALPVANGGTGLTAGTSGGILAYTASGTLASSSALTQYGVVYGGGAGAAPIATAAGTTGQVLSANTGSAPTWISAGAGTVTSVAATVPSIFSISGSPITSTGTLAMTYSGTALPVANGGTSLTTLTANNVILGNGTSAPAFVAPGSSGNLLTSNGTSWVSQASAAPVVAAGAIIYTALNFGGF